MNRLRTIASCIGAATLASPVFAQEAPVEIPEAATPESIIQAATEAAAKAEENAAPKIAPEKVKPTMSYGLGYQNGEQFGAFGFITDDLDKDAYMKGLIDALYGKEFANDEQVYDQAMKAFEKIVTDREIVLAKANEAAEKAFMEKNGKREGVITTESMLQYEIIKKGEGEVYKASIDNSTTPLFMIHCKGQILDETVIMETPKGEAFPFDLNVLPGIAEVLQIMPVGSKWKLYIPSALAFGQQRQGPKISPSSMLIYEIELDEIKAQPVQPSMPNMPFGPGQEALIPEPILPR